MLTLKQARVYKYKSINDSKAVYINDRTTVLVGKNESGKTAFLEALSKSSPLNEKQFDITYDYPKREYTKYKKKHESKDYDKVVELTFELSTELINTINTDLFFGVEILKKNFTITRTTNYGNKNAIGIVINNESILKSLKENLGDLEHIDDVFKESKTLRDVINNITALGLPADSKLHLFAETWKKRENTESKEWGIIDWHIYSKYIQPHIPKFSYFDDYKILSGKINLLSLNKRKSNNELTENDETTLGLLQLAGISLNELMSEEGYENSKAKLEAISLSITDQIFEYWTQNQELSVEFDVRDDPKDISPYNSGKNLYIRVKNVRHGVTVPFDQRSKGFIWFFSFMTWFSAVKERLGIGNDEIILLLDEPGLSLHALAQADFLKYIDTLAEKYQLIYTTHSPFMIKGGQLENIRVVEDIPQVGTEITDKLESSGEDSLFPLQAALGYSIAQNLFIAENNILLEGPADLILLQHVSSLLESLERKYITKGIFVPVGGLDKLATFIALLGANKLNLVVLHDKAGALPQKIQDLINNKIIKTNKVLDYSMFRETKGLDTDIEDLFPIKLYIDAFNTTYKQNLNDKSITENELSKHPRIIIRINKWLEKNSIQLLKDGGFNHYRVAQNLIPLLNETNLPDDYLERFEGMFEKIEGLL